jgi:sporulation protein YlmC with PRC-barrel domain
MEMKRMPEGRSAVITERRTQTTGEEWSMSAEDAIGKKVVNPEREDLGTISDIRLAFPVGRVEYMVLKHGGMLGVGGKKFAIPPEALAYHSGEDVFTVNIDKRRLDEAPGFTEDNWPREADWSLIRSGKPRAEPPSREEAEAVAQSKTPPPEVVTTERVETREQRPRR